MALYRSYFSISSLGLSTQYTANTLQERTILFIKFPASLHIQKEAHAKNITMTELSGTKNFVANSIPNLKPLFLFRSVPKF